MKKLSLKLRLIISFLLVATFVWVASGVLSWFETRENMDEFFDTYQILLARQLSTVNWADLKPDAQKESNKIIDGLLDDGKEEDDALGFAVFDGNGKIVFHDGENGQFFHYNPSPAGFVDQKVDGDKWRLILVKSADKEFVIAVGQELEFREEAVLDMLLQSLIPWGAGLVLLLFASIFLISKELRPIRDLAKKIAGKRADDLSPIESVNVPQEIEPLIVSMNKLLKRIDEMIERERSFISDAAHELRSPLAALMVQLDVALIAGDDEKTRAKALENLGKGIERSSRLVDQLLTLSRLETNGKYEQLNAEDIDWKKIVEAVVAENKEQAKAKGILVKVVNEHAIPLAKGHNILWSLLLRNLVDNAIKYSPKKAEVIVELGDGFLKVVNSNTKVDKAVLANLGKRFYRPSGQDTNGSGLGLSIVKRIAQIHECRVDFENVEYGFCVRVARG